MLDKALWLTDLLQQIQLVQPLCIHHLFLLRKRYMILKSCKRAYVCLFMQE